MTQAFSVTDHFDDLRRKTGQKSSDPGVIWLMSNLHRSLFLIIRTTKWPTHTSCVIWSKPLPQLHIGAEKSNQGTFPHTLGRITKRTKCSFHLPAPPAAVSTHRTKAASIKCMCADNKNTPGECWDTSVWGHEVVFEIEVGEVLAVEELSRQLLQAAAGQVDWVHSLWCNLTQQKGRAGKHNRSE